MLLDHSLDDTVSPSEQYCHDWMHAFFITGIFNIVMFLLMGAIGRAKIDIYSALHEYLSLIHI